MGDVAYQVVDGIAVLTIDNPPVNCLSRPVRRGLLAGLARALADEAVVGIVLTGAGGSFSGGADIAEFDSGEALAEPSLDRTIFNAIEAARKPVVAALDGIALGGGFELALACHGRIASRTARVGLPEVSLGFLPGAGGTQRLPRAIGLEPSLDMILSGAIRTAGEFAGTPLFDEVIEGNAIVAARAVAGRLAGTDARAALLRHRKVEHAEPAGFLAFARAQTRRRRDAPPGALKAIDAIQAAVEKPFDEGIALERGLFALLKDSDEARALRHAYFAERRAGKVDGLAADAARRDIGRVAVIGAGTMGTGIAMCFADAGIPVTLIDPDDSAVARAREIIASGYDALVRRGQTSPDAARERAQRIAYAGGLDAAGEADLVVEAVFEDQALKEKVFGSLETIAKPGAILATNTSTLDVDALARATRRAESVIGMHFFNPANVMKLIEVVRGAATGDQALASVLALAKRLGKIAVVARVCDGFIGNRMAEQYLRQALFLLDEGALPWQVDRALENWGMAMGPFAMMDLVGNDLLRDVRKSRAVKFPAMVYSGIADRLCEDGRLGRKSGAGWYAYPAGARRGEPDPAVAALIETYATEIGLARRGIGDAEIVDRCVLALVNEGARLLDEGIAQRASDIDVVYFTGYGFPRLKGGPMFHAERRGLLAVCETMQRFAASGHGDRGFWQPAPLLARLARDGMGFA